MKPHHHLTLQPRLAPACTIAALLVWLPLVTGCAQGSAGPSGGESLQDRRRAISQGTAPGIVFYTPRSRTDAASAPSGPAAPAAQTTQNTPGPSSGKAAPVPTRPSAVPAATPPSTGFFGSLPPPSGRPINDAKKLNAPDQGIPVPTAGSASSAR